MCREVERERATHRLTSNHDVITLRGQLIEGRRNTGRPILPARSLQVMRRRAVAGKHRCVASIATGCQHLAKATQLWRRAGEAVDEECSARSIAKAPGADDLRVEGGKGARGHASEYMDRAAHARCYRRPRWVRR
jgi:hypothetical protein